MSLGGLLLGLLLSCDVRVESEPVTIAVDSTPTCWSKKKGFDKSIDSSVRITFVVAGEEVGKASGNYFKYRGKTFVLTAAHVALASTHHDGAQLVVKERFGIDRSLAKPVYIDEATDLAVLVLERELTTIEPLKWLRKDYWDVDVGDEVYYTGHPMDMDYMSFKGSVSKIYSDLFIMQSWAYMGSSGAAIFDSRGRVVGVVSAIKYDIHAVPQMMPSLVLVAPLTYLSNQRLYEILNNDGSED